MQLVQIQHTTEIEFKRLLCSAFHAFDANSGCKQESVKLSTALRIRYTKTILLTNQSRNRPSCPDHYRSCNQDIEATLLVRFQYQDFCLPLPAWIHRVFQLCLDGCQTSAEASISETVSRKGHCGLSLAVVSKTMGSLTTWPNLPRWDNWPKFMLRKSAFLRLILRRSIRARHYSQNLCRS